SHNPFEDNGIKVFSGRGEKFTEALEQQVEAIIHDASWQVPAAGLPPVDRTDVIDPYLAHTRLAFPDPGRLGHFQIAIHAAHGATTTGAPRLFRAPGHAVHVHG